MKKKMIKEALELLQVLTEDEDAGKILRERAKTIITILSGGAELCVEKALLELEELNSLGLSSYQRTQVWDIVSLLESTK